jgi:tetratricopeptide (TPR) repeat protein
MPRLPPLLFLLCALAACTPAATTQVDRDLSRSIEAGQLTGDQLAAAYVDRGTLRLLNDDYDAGIADYDAAIAAAPGYAPAYTWRGQARDAKGDDRGAIADFDHAVSLDPQAWQAYGARGLLLARTGEPARALADLGQAIELGKSHEKEFLIQHTSLTPMQLFNPKGPSESGTVRADFMLRADHYLSFLRAIRGGLLVERGRYDEALIDLDEATRLNPQSPRALWNYGLVQLAIGRCKEGVAELRAASALTLGASPAYMSVERNRAFVAKTPCSEVAR